MDSPDDRDTAGDETVSKEHLSEEFDALLAKAQEIMDEPEEQDGN